MYIWIGCALPETFERELRERTLPLAEELKLGLEPFSLPQHISLKISFEDGGRTEEVLAAVEEMLRKERAFAVHPAGIERHGSILWITFRENGTLRRLHNLLDRELKQRFCIEQHLFDRAFMFHSSIYIGEEALVIQGEERLRDLRLPEELRVNRFLLGMSPAGKAGTYQVVREIKV